MKHGLPARACLKEGLYLLGHAREAPYPWKVETCTLPVGACLRESPYFWYLLEVDTLDPTWCSMPDSRTLLLVPDGACLRVGPYCWSLPESRSLLLVPDGACLSRTLWLVPVEAYLRAGPYLLEVDTLNPTCWSLPESRTLPVWGGHPEPYLLKHAWEQELGFPSVWFLAAVLYGDHHGFR